MTDTITTDPLPAVDLRGRKLGELVVGDCIGKGGFGALYLADQPLLGRQAVVKVLHDRLRANNEALERFMREARLASRLDHPYAAHIYAFGVEAEDGLAWIAMEHVHGTTLAHWLRVRGRLPLAELVPFIEHVAEVVQTAHDSGIIHRDLKPSNVMVIERAGRWLPKLLDFGIAKLVTEVAQPETRPTLELAPTQPALTQANATLGSPPYMSPEQFDDPLTVGPAADIYSLGVMAYELLAGRRPFEANDTAAFDFMHRNAPVPPLGMSPALDHVFQRVLAKDPKQRPASVLAFVTELKRAAAPSHRRVAVIAGLVIAAAVAVISIIAVRSGDEAAVLPLPLPTASTTPPPAAPPPTMFVVPAVVPTVVPSEPGPKPPAARPSLHPPKRPVTPPPPPPPVTTPPQDLGAQRL
jgi:serine/threonine protein kinase